MGLKKLIFMFWYLVWFVLIPLVFSVIVINLLAKAAVVDEFEPWYVLALFAVMIIIMYSARAKLPLWRDKDKNSPYNQARRARTARGMVGRIRKILDKRGYKVSQRGKEELGAALGNLESAIEGGDHEKIPGLAKKLEEKASRHMPFAKKSVGREYFESIGVAILVAVILRLFVLEAFKIPSESMVPTLMVGDHIFVTKYLYGISLPFSNKRLIHFADPDRGEVIVFVKPSIEEQTGFPPQVQMPSFFEEYEMVGKDFIKRIVALPGDEVQMKDDVLYINKKKVPRCKVGTRTYRSLNKIRDKWEDHEGELWVEKHGDYIYTIVEEVDAVPFNFGPITVPEGQVFVLGDNRDNSNDSRYWGSVPIDNIKGRAGMIWWSNRRPHGFQWDRVGDFIMHYPELTDEQEAALEKCDLGK